MRRLPRSAVFVLDKSVNDAGLEYLVDFRKRAVNDFYIWLSKRNAPPFEAEIKREIIDHYAKKMNPSLDVECASKEVEAIWIRCLTRPRRERHLLRS